MKTQYEVDGMIKFSEEDIFNDGCQPNSGINIDVDIRLKAETIEELINKICSFLGIENKPDNYQLDSCEEEGRIDFSLLETEEGQSATQGQISLWKQGKLRLWNCIYSAYVEKVTREAISLTPIK